tara:strand:- start:207 stop:890 length:684 start_codon:yes stop_codon:yes gene_type:complete
MIFLSKFKIFLYIVIFFSFFKSNLIKSVELTEAHKILVGKDHLSNLKTPTKIKYIFRRTGSLEPGFNDRVVMIVPEKDDKGVHNIKFDFFSSYNKEDIKSANYKTNNPIVHAFWEHDIQLMTHLTKGSWIYFRKRITWAMSDPYKFKIIPAECVINEKKVEGQTVELIPYEQDYDSKNFEKFAKKRYYVTVCEQVPGMIYEMSTIVPSSDGSKPLMKETLTFEKILN